MSTPIVPPRPARNAGGPSPVKNETPLVPPRPIRNIDPSPERETYTRSPLNAPPGAVIGKPPTASGRSSQELPRRPPSVSLPSVGQEGSEYSSYDQLPDGAHDASLSAEQTTSVSPDLPMHQPRASLPQASAKRQIQTVTRTDSTQAAAAGIGKPSSHDDGPGSDTGAPLGRATSYPQNSHSYHHHHYGGKRAPSTERHPLRARSSFNRSTSNLAERNTSRPSSVYGDDHEHGIPEIGRQIPLNPMAGDVQAPSPAPTQSQHAPGIGFFNDGSQRAQARRKSSRQDFGPPGSYGLHHDHDHQDQFEKAWVAKHPEEAAKEESYMHLPRPASALTSEQLNKLVGQGQTDIGMGTSANAIGTPEPSTAFEVTAQYAGDRSKRLSTGSQPPDPHRRSLSAAGFRTGEGDEYDHVYHVTPPTQTTNKVTGGGEADGKKDLGPHASREGGWINEHGDGAPILASDEILKRPGSAYMQAAVIPDHHDDHYDSDHSRRNSLQMPRSPSSRPTSMHGGYHGGALHRYVSHEDPHHSGPHTPLEEIEEYEPLFPENEKLSEKPKAFKKRPELIMHHFPSQDVWEDTPASLQYSTTVSTPDLERQQESLDVDTVAATFEPPEAEQQRRDENPDDMTSDKKTFVKPHFKPGVIEELRNDRPGVQRFPSSDIWEDTPDSMRLETTVTGPQMDDSIAQPEDRPATGGLDGDHSGARASTGIAGAMRPNVPSRPERKSKLDQEVKDVRDRETADPASIGRAKPSVPARPARPIRAEHADDGRVAPPVPKAKPVVPARPGGEKIAAMKAGFMNDLNNRLKLGPQAPPVKKEVDAEAEEETAKEPLVDARKSRARGPMRRKPGTSAVAEFKSSTFAISPLITVWSIDEEDELQLAEETEPKRPTTQETEQAFASNEAANTKEPAFAAPRDAVAAAGAEGDAPEPSISAAVAQEQQAIAPEMEAALEQSESAPKSFEAREKADLEAAVANPTVMATASSGDQE